MENKIKWIIVFFIGVLMVIIPLLILLFKINVYLGICATGGFIMIYSAMMLED